MRFDRLMASRLRKVAELQEHRGYACEGNRELMCFVYYNTAVQLYERPEAFRRLGAFNARFVRPLPCDELEGVRSAVDGVVNVKGERGHYILSAQTLIRLLALTPAEIEATRFFTSKRAAERAEAKRITRARRDDRDQRICNLYATGDMTQREVAKAVGCSQKTVYRALKKAGMTRIRTAPDMEPADRDEETAASLVHRPVASPNRTFPVTRVLGVVRRKAPMPIHSSLVARTRPLYRARSSLPAEPSSSGGERRRNPPWETEQPANNTAAKLRPQTRKDTRHGNRNHPRQQAADTCRSREVLPRGRAGAPGIAGPHRRARREGGARRGTRERILRRAAGAHRGRDAALVLRPGGDEGGAPGREAGWNTRAVTRGKYGSKLLRTESTEMIIGICNLKGGTGKTTAAIYLATEAAESGFSAAVLDCDPQASATLWANYAEDAGTPLPFSVDSANIGTLERKAGAAAGSGDTWAFVDCPPSGSIVSTAAELADMVVIPTGTGAGDMLKTVALAEALVEKDIFCAVLVERAAANTVALRETLAELDERGIDYFEHVVPAREEIRNTYGNPCGSRRHGFEGVFSEIVAALCGEEE